MLLRPVALLSRSGEMAGGLSSCYAGMWPLPLLPLGRQQSELSGLPMQQGERVFLGVLPPSRKHPTRVAPSPSLAHIPRVLL